MNSSDEDLAATGGSGITPLIAGGAAVLIAVGGATLLVLRRRNPVE
ncbi:LAETG motif-containing sortase-dependent surface protein [Streptomyces sp. NPDC000594]